MTNIDKRLGYIKVARWGTPFDSSSQHAPSEKMHVALQIVRAATTAGDQRCVVYWMRQIRPVMKGTDHAKQVLDAVMKRRTR
jgi:hypothetical protein